MTKEYKKLIETILFSGSRQECRNGGQIIIPNYSFTLDFGIEDSYKLKLRKMYYKGAHGEFLTLIDDKEPLTNVSQFEARGCNYWSKWAGPNGELNLDYANMLRPQLKQVIEQIKVDPYSRRHVIELWNYENVPNLSLPCCWHGITFSVIGDTLHMKWTQRSVDTMIGLPTDIYLAYLFMSYVSIHTDLLIGTCMFSLSNVHIYEEHIDNAHELLERDESYYNEPLKFELKA